LKAKLYEILHAIADDLLRLNRPERLLQFHDLG